MLDYEQENKDLLDETLKRAFKALPEKETKGRFASLLEELARREHDGSVSRRP